MAKLTFDENDVKKIYMTTNYMYSINGTTAQLSAMQDLAQVTLLKRPIEDWWTNSFRGMMTISMGTRTESPADWAAISKTLDNHITLFKSAMAQSTIATVADNHIYFNGTFAYTWKGDLNELGKLEDAIEGVMYSRDNLLRSEQWRHRRFRDSLTVTYELPTQSFLGLDIFRAWMEANGAPLTESEMHQLFKWIREQNKLITDWLSFTDWLKGQEVDVIYDWDDVQTWLEGKRKDISNLAMIDWFKIYMKHQYNRFLDTIDDAMVEYEYPD